MTIARSSWNRVKTSRDAGLYLTAVVEVAAAFCVALLCKTDALVRLSASWNGWDLIIRNGEIVGLNR